MPNLVRDDLPVRVLRDKADRSGAGALIQFRLCDPGKADVALFFPVGRDFAFEQLEQRGLSAAGSTTQHNKLSVRNGEGHILQGGGRLFWVGKC